LLKSSNHGEKTFVQNNQFGWRFFGPRAARQPAATSIPRVKPPDTVRIFVFGESAAYGDPQPRFGLPRMLEAMLELRHPDKKFEVVLAAVELEPDQAQPHMQLGVELGRLGKPALAEQEFRQVLRLDPNVVEARVNLGIALYQQEKLEDALRQFEHVLQRNPNDPNAQRYIQLLRSRTSSPAGR
jgi:tetratricopeptide (TPR) repeat protein